MVGRIGHVVEKEALRVLDKFRSSKCKIGFEISAGTLTVRTGREKAVMHLIVCCLYG
jgi:hypothetical protein